MSKRNRSETYRLHISGDYACFTRPEMKIERVSYDIITPSAARGVLEAILWKPAIRWNIEQIELLKPIQWTSVRRNEVKEVASIANAKKAMNAGKGDLGLLIEDHRLQRASLLLRDVAYVIQASFHMTDAAGEREDCRKFEQMFRRRMDKGQHFHHPYLGCREFPACVRWAEESDQALSEENRSLGWMLLDMNYSSKNPYPMFFNAEFNKGIVRVPSLNSEEVRS